MSLVESLLGAILKLDGDSLVLHTGEKPYVVTSSSAMNAFRGPLAWGQVELSTKTLTVPAVVNMLAQLLTDEQRHVLEDMGAVEHRLPATEERPAFHVVVARGGDDIWVEIRPVRVEALQEPAAEPLPAPEGAPQPAEMSSEAPLEAAAEMTKGPTLEVVPEVEQVQPDADAVAALLASSGLTPPGPGASPAAADGAVAHVRSDVAALLEEEQARLAAAREEAARLEESTRKESLRLQALREEAERLEASRDEAARLAALADEEATRKEADARAAAEALALASRQETNRLQALREEAAALERAREVSARNESARLDALRAEAAQMEAAAREETRRIAALREEAARLEAARDEAARIEAAARQEAERLQHLRDEAARLTAAREQAEQLETIAREQAARVQGLRDEADRLEMARAEASRIEAAAREEASRIAAVRDEAARLEAARAEAVRAEAVRAEAARAEAAAREEATRVAEAVRTQNLALETAREQIDQLREALRSEAERLDVARRAAADAERQRAEAERREQERVEALREAQRREHGRLEELRAEAVRLETLRRDEEKLMKAAREEAARWQAGREEAQRLEASRQDGEQRLQALVDSSREDAEPAAGISGGSAEPSARPPEKLQPAAIPDEPVVAAEVPPGVQADDARPAHVLPLVRVLREQPLVTSTPGGPAAPDLDRLLRIAAARGASGLYLVSRSRPAVRVDGDMQPIDGEEPLSAADVEAFMLALVPEPSRDSVRSGATVEWFCDVPEIGRVRCLSFRDHRGPGVIVRMLPARAVSAEQLGLSREIQAISTQPDGLVLIAGPRASGKSTTLAAFVDLINRTRADHVITIERQVTFVHESQRAFVSQREVRGEAHEVLAAVRAALREDPDVLVVEELRSPEVVAAVLESAESGRLVLAGLRAPASAQAVERLMDQVPADRRAQALSALSTSLRGVISQVLLRKRTGGRVAARELLLNTPAAAAVLAEGKLFQLGAALESGRKLGSLPLNDTLAALIRDGVIDPAEAWRKAYDREGLLTLLKREGIDTSFVERLA